MKTKRKPGMYVCAKKCDQCLFSQNRIVSASRAVQVLRSAKKDDQHFVCHKHTLRALEGQCSEDDANVVCRGYYDANPGATNFMRVMHRLGMVYFVDEAGNIVEGERVQ